MFHRHTPDGYRADIDGMRAFAVLSVILFHFHIPGFRGGYVGVDIFFVISGYLISSILLRELDTGTFSIARFYERRIRRIVPALVVVLIATTIASALFMPPDKLAEFGRSVVATSLFYSNIFFSSQVGYFRAAASTQPLLHTWSLGVEEQFYIVWPIFLFVAYALGLTRTKLWALVATLAVAGLMLAERKSGTGNASRYFFLPQTRMWELMIGALVAFQFCPRLPARWQREAAAGTGIAMMVFAVVMFSNTTPFPSTWTLFPCLGAALIIHAGQSGASLTSRLLSFYPFVFVGLISYSLYLWHWPIFVFASALLDRPITLLEAVQLIVLSIAVSVLSWRFVETPFRRSPAGTSKRLRLIFAGALALIVTSAAGLVMHVSGGLPQRLDAETLRFYRASMDFNPLRKHCHTDGVVLPSSEKCIVPPSKDDTYNILVWGDSHADAFFPAAVLLAEKYGQRARQATKSGCLPLLGAERFTRRTRDNRFTVRGCEEYNEAMIKMLEKGPRPALVILTGRWSLYTGKTDEKQEAYLVDKLNKSLDYENSRQVLRTALQRTLSSINDLGIAVLLVGQSPEFDANPNDCYVKNRLLRTDVSHCLRQPRPTAEQALAASNYILKEVAAQSRRTTFVRMDDVFCDSEYCWAAKGGAPLYSDDHHVSPLAARELISIALTFPEIVELFTKNRDETPVQ